MRVRSGSAPSVGAADVFVPGKQPLVGAPPIQRPSTSQDGPSKQTNNIDVVTLQSQGMAAAQLRLLRLSNLRESIQSGQYNVPAESIAAAMQRKIALGQAPELSPVPELDVTTGVGDGTR